MYMHAYTLYSAIRPYGCSIILASYEHGEPVMYTIDPSGISYVSSLDFTVYVFTTICRNNRATMAVQRVKLNNQPKLK